MGTLARDPATRRLSREVNDRIAEVGRHFVSDDTDELMIGVACECGSLDCEILLELTLREYEDVSAQAGHWIIANSVATRDDAIVARRDGHVVIDDPA